jgi:hypothetical protein
MSSVKVLLGLVLGVLALAACGSDESEHALSELHIASQVSFSVDFSSTDDFEVGVYEGNSSLTIRDGSYRIQTANTTGASYLWGKSDWNGAAASYPLLKNVRVEVEAASVRGDADNWFGVMCRMDDGETGYAFLISDDGFWAIARADGQRGLTLLEPWRESREIRKGSPNTLQAYCVDNYLALYVNGKFAGDYTDSRFDRVGSVGLLAGGAQGNEIEVSFDNLVVRAAAFENRPNTPTSTTAATAIFEPTQSATSPALSPVPLQPILPVTPSTPDS